MSTNKSKSNRFKNRRNNFSKIDISDFDFQTIYEYERQRNNLHDDFDDEYKKEYELDDGDEDYDDSLRDVVIEGDDYGYSHENDVSQQDNRDDDIERYFLDDDYLLKENFEGDDFFDSDYFGKDTRSEAFDEREYLKQKYSLDDYIKNSDVSKDVLKYELDDIDDINDINDIKTIDDIDDINDIKTIDDVLKQMENSNKSVDMGNDDVTPKNKKSFNLGIGMSSMRKKKKNVKDNKNIYGVSLGDVEHEEEKIDKELVKDFYEDEKDNDLDYIFSNADKSLTKEDFDKKINEDDVSDQVGTSSELEKRKLPNPLDAIGKMNMFMKKDEDVNSDEDILKDYEKNELPIIELCDVSKSYQEGIEAINNISFKINQGEFVFVVGKSGSGKSTLINLLTRQIRPTSGNVYVNGSEIAKLPDKKISKYRRSIGIVFQDFKLLPDRNVYDNVAFAQRVVEKTDEEIEINVPSILSIVGLKDRHEAFPNELSGGEKQRVAIARALVNQPSILLADEPTGNLDPKTAWEIMDLLDEINKKGTTVIVVTHNVDIVNIMKKRVIAIEDGNIVSDEQEGGYIHED